MLQTIFSTEVRLLEPIADFTDGDGYRVIRSEQFPNYYGGNAIQIVEARGRTLADWESIAREWFDPSRFRHTTLYLAGGDEHAQLIADAEAAGYHVDREAYMFVDHDRNVRAVPDAFEVRRLDTEEEWARLLEFEEASYVNEDWYDPNYKGPNRLFEKTRFVSEAIGIEWFYLARHGAQEILSKLGVFSHGGIARLQDVETASHYRRQGYASYMVSYAIEYALHILAVEGVALVADLDYYAIDLYKKLGFVQVGEGVTLMKYPVKNPKFLNEESNAPKDA